MSFCGTIEHNRRWKMMGFGMFCSGLASQLLDLQEERYAVSEGKRPKRAEGEEDGQMRLFPLDIKQREEFTKLAKNIRWFMKRDEKREHDAAYWKAYRDIEYADYEFWEFFERYADDELEPFVVMLEKIGSGEQLEDYHDLMDFLHRMGSRAHAISDDARGGCF